MLQTSSSTKISKLGDLNLYRLQIGDSIADISSFGAQATSWSIANKDIFYNNPCLITDKSKALRSGAPLCFPWFNKGWNWNLGRDITPSHGAARTSEWRLDSDILNTTVHNTNSVQIGFSLETNSHIGKPLNISVLYTLSPKSLLCEFKVENRGAEQNMFELAIHSYFATSKPAEVAITGLEEHPNSNFQPALPIDKIFNNTGDKLTAQFFEYNLAIENNGFSKSVIWHPGLEHSLTDLPKGTSAVPFLCLESLSNTENIASMAIWKGSVCYSIS